jgi:hypothetical protein
MSYDLMVFDAAQAPSERAEFLEWYEKQSEWEEPHSYDDPAVSSAALRAWFMEMIEAFPAMNGPHRRSDLPEDIGTLTDYAVGKSVIYAAFRWSKAEVAYAAMFRLAEKHRVGFFNASSDRAEVWLPGPSGGLLLAHAD